MGIKIYQDGYQNKSRWVSKYIKMGMKIYQDGYQNVYLETLSLELLNYLENEFSYNF